MDLLEVPLDALAFRLYSLPAAAAAARSDWACLVLLAAAAAAAALGLWGIRAVGSKPDPPTPTSPPPPPVPSLPVCPSENQTPVGREVAAAAWTASCHVEEARSPKSRFMAYYAASTDSLYEDCADGGGLGEGEEEDVDSVSDVDRRVTAPWSGGGCGLEWAVVKRRGDLGWYRYQDMTALDGSVVKLWDGRDGGLTATAGRRLPRRP
ncbi:hypothetical protein MUK42_00947 [Musa troglodytarum]|uniref:Uncharacterized protein n=1 Tax=Musa troglodytarum TaxID=320322 RepID=A0A9E7JTX9_9LILI|nr:hypothetical protein MUK42_00947 [Musa troglodytarum]